LLTVRAAVGYFRGSWKSRHRRRSTIIAIITGACGGVTS
jgi:hypothetical protein